MKKFLLIACALLWVITGCIGTPSGNTPGTVVAQKTRISPSATFTATRRPAATATPVQPTPTATRAAATATARPSATPTRARATATARPSATPTRPAPQAGSIVVDHRSVALFEQIPEQYLTAARNLRMMFMDQSVGMNISQGLDCLAADSWGSSGAYCRRDYYQISGSQWLWKTYTNADLQSGTVPETILFPADSTRYNRSNWTYVTQRGSWQEYLSGFLRTHAPAAINQNDVLSYQFTYLHVDAGSDIADPQEGFFTDQPHNGYYPNQERWDISDLREYQAQNPNKVFIYWTTSLARGIGSDVSTTFNEQMRQYAMANGMPLFDSADILSHDPAGNPCYDNRDGVEYCSGGECENNPDDGKNNPAICQAYTTELEGGHLGSVSGGRMRMAKAFWVLMAQIAGWRP